MVVRLLKPLGLEQQLLIELLAGTQPGVDYLDIHIRFKAAEADHLARHVVNAHGLPHVEHEHLAALGVSPGLQDERNSLRDRHKEARHALVGNRHRAALGDLLLEQRDNAAVAAKDIAEADGDVICAAVTVHRLHDHLAQTL